MNKMKLSVVSLALMASVASASDIETKAVLNMGQVNTDYANGVITDSNNNYSIGVEVLKEVGSLKIGVGALYDIVKTDDGDSKSKEIDLILSKQFNKISVSALIGKSYTDLSTNQDGETLFLGFGADYKINDKFSLGLLYKQGDMDISDTQYDMEVKYTQATVKYTF